MSRAKVSNRKPGSAVPVVYTPTKVKQNKVHVELAIPDCHIPYEDKKAYQLMLAVASDNQVDGITLLGDYGDFFGVGSHGNSPGVKKDFEWEVKEVNIRLDELDKKFPGVPKTYIQGNHEWRLERYIANNAEMLDGVIDSSDVLKMKKRKNWMWVPYTSNQIVKLRHSKLYARHEPLAGSIHCAYGSVVKAGVSLIFGHTHRVQESQVVMANGDQHIGISAGWLGDPLSKVFEYDKNFHQWSQGFVMIEILPSGLFFHHFCRIIKYKGVYTTSYNGKLYYV